LIRLDIYFLFFSYPHKENPKEVGTYSFANVR